MTYIQQTIILVLYIIKMMPSKWNGVGIRDRYTVPSFKV